MRLTVSVPATSANLGPGFDALGMALALPGERTAVPDGRPELGLVVTAEPSDRLLVQNRGEGAARLPTGWDHLVLRAARRLADEAGRELPTWRLVVKNGVPPSRGLGSSAAAVVAGLLLADEALGRPLGPEGVLSLATELEGHPDNVAAALGGGVTLALRDDAGRVLVRPVPVARVPGLVLAVPARPLATRRARSVLPRLVPLSDAVYNLGRSALLVLALSGGEEGDLEVALGDRLHQPHRFTLVPEAAVVREAARGAGAWGVTLSGAGSTLLAWCPPGRAGIVEEAIARALAAADLDARVFPAVLAHEGANVRSEPLTTSRSTRKES